MTFLRAKCHWIFYTKLDISYAKITKNSIICFSWYQFTVIIIQDTMGNNINRIINKTTFYVLSRYFYKL